MAFMLKETTRVLFNVSCRGWGRVLPVHANQQQCLYHSHNRWNKLYYFRSICTNQDLRNIEQVVESTSTTMPLPQDPSTIEQVVEITRTTVPSPQDPSTIKQAIEHIVKSTRTTMPSRQFAPVQNIKEDLISNFDASRAIEVVSDHHNRRYKSVSYLIDAVVTDLVSGEDNRAEEVVTFLKGIVENKIPIYSATYNKVLKNLYDHEMNDQFFELVQFMQDNGTEPDVHHSYQLLKMANRVVNVNLAQICFDKIIGCEEYPHKGPVYSNLIYAYYKEALLQRNYGMVIKWYNKMMEAGFEPSRSVHVLAIRSYLRSGDDDGAKSVVEKRGGDALTFTLKYESAKRDLWNCSESEDYEGMKQVIENEDGAVKDNLINFIKTRTRLYEKIYE